MSSLLRGRPASTIAWLAAWGVCAAVALARLAEPTRTPVIEDEIYWIGSAYYYDLAFHQGDWRNADWDLLPARENPPIAKYVIGASLAASGQRVASIDLLGSFYAMFESLPEAWGRGEDQAKRARVVARMEPGFHRQIQQTGQSNVPPDYLLPPRRTMILCAALTSLIVFLFGVGSGRSLAGWLASVLLLLHPAVVQAYNHALADAVALVFSTAAALAAFGFFHQLLAPGKFSPRNSGLLSVAVGVLLALACGAKMNSLIVVVLLGATTLALAWQRGRSGDTAGAARVLGYGAAALIFGLVIFIGLNPAILHDVWGGLVATVREHRLTEVIQARFIGDHLTSMSGKFSAVAVLVYGGGVGMAVFTAVVAAVLYFDRADQRVLYVAAWWLIALVCVTPWIPFPRTRYVLPLVVPSVLLAGHAVALLVGFLFAKVGAGRQDSSPA